MWLNMRAVEERLETRYLGRRAIYLTSTSSTQDVARREAEDGAVDGTIVIAEEQTAGRGRLGRSWVSPAGRNLYFTLILRPPLPRMRSLSIVSPLAVSLAVEGLTTLSPRLKWPNDVLVRDRKLSGVIIESELADRSVKYALVGIGVNVNFDVDEAADIADTATSLKRELRREISREELLAVVLNHFEALYETDVTSTLVQLWRERLDTLGKRVRVTLGNHVQEGLAEDVDDEGNLILVRSDGSRVLVESGEVTLRS
jgi:BirA family biotin operon repressor/biotin-[acetyl-CoA-carboxylase] ligase